MIYEDIDFTRALEHNDDLHSRWGNRTLYW